MMGRMLVQSAAEDVSKAIDALEKQAALAPGLAAEWAAYLINQLQRIT